MPEPKNWKRHAVEVVVIVGSILLAFGIEAWWEGQQERGRELGYLRAIESDMGAASEALTEAFSQNNLLAVTVDTMLVLLRSGDSHAIAETEWTSYLGFQAHPPSVPTGALHSLVRSGEVHLVRSEDLRATLISEAAKLDRNLAWIDEVMSQAGYNLQAFMLAWESLRTQAQLTGTAVSFQQLRTSPEISASYATHSIILTNILISIQGVQEAVEAIHQAVQQELLLREG